jgi:hypothetical protein
MKGHLDGWGVLEKKSKNFEFYKNKMTFVKFGLGPNLTIILWTYFLIFKIGLLSLGFNYCCDKNYFFSFFTQWQDDDNDDSNGSVSTPLDLMLL